MPAMKSSALKDACQFIQCNCYLLLVCPIPAPHRPSRALYRSSIDRALSTQSQTADAAPADADGRIPARKAVARLANPSKIWTVFSANPRVWRGAIYESRKNSGLHPSGRKNGPPVFVLSAHHQRDRTVSMDSGTPHFTWRNCVRRATQKKCRRCCRLTSHRRWHNADN